MPEQSDQVPGLPTAEKLGATVTLLQEIWGNLRQIMTNPLLAGPGMMQIGQRWEKNIIEKFKATNSLTKEQEILLNKQVIAFDKATRGAMIFTGAVGGAALRVAMLTEKLEDATAQSARFFNLDSMPGGKTFENAFQKTAERQKSYFRNMGDYGEEFANKFANLRDRIGMAMKQEGWDSGASETFVKNLQLMSDYAGTDVSQAIWSLRSQFGGLGVNMGRASEITRDILTAWSDGTIKGNDFGEVMGTIIENAAQLRESGMDFGSAWKSAVGLSQQLSAANIIGPEARKLTQRVSASRVVGSSEQSSLYAMAQYAGTYGGDFTSFARKLANQSAPETLAFMQRTAKKMGNFGNLPMSQQMLVQQMFGGAGGFRSLTDIGDLGTNLKSIGKDISAMDGRGAANATGTFIKDMAELHKKTGNFIDQLKGLAGEYLETPAAGAVGKSLMYGLGVGLPLWMMMRKGRAFKGMLSGAVPLLGMQAVLGGGLDSAGGGVGGGGMLSNVVDMLLLQKLMGKGAAGGPSGWARAGAFLGKWAPAAAQAGGAGATALSGIEAYKAYQSGNSNLGALRSIMAITQGGLTALGPLGGAMAMGAEGVAQLTPWLMGKFSPSRTAEGFMENSRVEGLQQFSQGQIRAIQGGTAFGVGTESEIPKEAGTWINIDLLFNGKSVFKEAVKEASQQRVRIDLNNSFYGGGVSPAD